MSLITFVMHVCRMVEKDDSSSPDISKIADASKVTVEEDVLNLTPMTTIEGLKDCAEVIEKISFLYGFLFLVSKL